MSTSMSANMTVNITTEGLKFVKRKRVFMSKCTLILFAASLGFSNVHGAGFALKEQSAYGQGKSFAGMAAGGAISTSFWNPANFSEAGDKIEYEAILSLIDSETIIETTGSSNLIYAGLEDKEDIGGSAVLPAGYLAGRINEKTAWGVGITVPFGLGSEANRGTRSQYVALESEAGSFNIAPSITYEASPGFNIAAGLQLQTFDATLSQALPVGASVGVFSANDPVLEISGDDSGALGYTLGFNYSNASTSFGIGYRSSIEHVLEGNFRVDAFGIDAPISLDLETPSMISIGLNHRLNNKWLLSASHNITDWSVFGTLPVISDQTGEPVVFNGNSVALPFEYVDTTFTSIGFDYTLSESVVLRAGIGLDETTNTSTTRTTRLPDTDRIWLSFGATHKLKKGQIDWGFTHVSLDEEADINIVPGHIAYSGLPFTAVSDPTVNILSVSYKGRF